MKHLINALVILLMFVACTKQVPSNLRFDPSQGTSAELVMPNGEKVHYTAYEHLYFVENIEDSTYQYMNIYIPDGATQRTPIFLRTYVGGYMASEAAQPQAGDATGRALQEGYVVCIPGARGRNSRVGDTFTGRAPAALLDLKAAVRYLRHFDREMLGSAERIITDGTSAGGAMSSLLGATGNSPEYEPLLDAMGAAKERDDVFASVCYCPIIDLEHADMAYEWLFQGTDSRLQATPEQRQVTEELAALYPAYFNALGLRKPDGTLLTTDNLMDYIRELLIHSAQIAKNAGADIPDSLGFTFSETSMGRFRAPINGGQTGMPSMQQNKQTAMPPMPQGGQIHFPMQPMRKQQGEYITGLDMQRYLNYVVSTQPLKGVPAFDSKGVLGAAASGENEEFGDATESSVNFTDYSAAKNGVTLSDDLRTRVEMMNPIVHIADGKSTNAPHWYIRHGARDRDTAFPVPVILATKLQNSGADVNFLLSWNRPHSGDYALDELFEWMAEITK